MEEERPLDLTTKILDSVDSTMRGLSSVSGMEEISLFEMFLRRKATIYNVMEETLGFARDQGIEPVLEIIKSKAGDLERVISGREERRSEQSLDRIR